jgi:hypothetical protein
MQKQRYDQSSSLTCGMMGGMLPLKPTTSKQQQQHGNNSNNKQQQQQQQHEEMDLGTLCCGQLLTGQ